MFEYINKIIAREITEEQALELARKMTADKLEDFMCDLEMVTDLHDDPESPDTHKRLSDLHWEMEKILEDKNKE